MPLMIPVPDADLAQEEMPFNAPQVQEEAAPQVAKAPKSTPKPKEPADLTALTLEELEERQRQAQAQEAQLAAAIHAKKAQGRKDAAIQAIQAADLTPGQVDALEEFIRIGFKLDIIRRDKAGNPPKDGQESKPGKRAKVETHLNPAHAIWDTVLSVISKDGTTKGEIYKALEFEGFITQHGYKEATYKTKFDSFMIEPLREAGYIRMEGEKRSAKWFKVKETIDAEELEQTRVKLSAKK